MRRFECIRERMYNADGTSNVVADMQVSTASELPVLGVAVDGMYIMPGSIAQIIQADELTFVTMDEDGTWYPEQS